MSETELDRYAADDRATVNEAAGIAGVDVHQLAGHKVEQRIGWQPVGAQYDVWATKGPAGLAIPSRPASRRAS